MEWFDVVYCIFTTMHGIRRDSKDLVIGMFEEVFYRKDVVCGR
jgi:hypothetical protein